MTDPGTPISRALDGLREHERVRTPDRYQIRELLGRGGMASVYRARDTQLNRDVAYKVLAEGLGDDEGRARFRREAEAAARPAHPNVVTVFDAGPDFLVMELVRGRSLADALRDRPDARTVARWMEKIARGVQAAHEAGIIHRDLKPSNVMLADDEPKVADFGIAQLVDQATALTASGMLVGTPQYMAPEQVEARRDEIGPRTDVWALGGMLYEALAGRPAFGGDSPAQVMRSILFDEPAPPEGELGVVAMKALEKEPARRYASAAAFADDLARWLDGRPIEARPSSMLYKLRKRAAKRAGTLVVAGLGLVALAALVLVVGELGRARSAQKLWSHVTAIERDAELLSRDGEIEASRAKLDEGIALCREAPDLVEANYFLGRLLRARGDLDGAEAALTRAESMGEARLERGLLFARRYEDMLYPIRVLYAGRPPGSGSKEPPRGDELEALHPALRRWRELAERDLEARVGVSAYFKEADRAFIEAELASLRWEWVRAEELYARVPSGDPSYPRARLALAKMWYFRTEYERAADEADRALRKHEGLGEAYLIRGAVRGDLADLDRAVDLLGSSAAYTARGEAHFKARRWDEAVADNTRAIELLPTNAVAYNHRGAAIGMRRPADAIPDLDEAIRLSPTYAMAHFNRAYAKLQCDDAEGAIEDAERALKLAPEQAPYRGQIESLVRMLRD